MRIRRFGRTKGGRHYGYWGLVQSYRTERGPRERVVAYLGDMDEALRLGVAQAATGQAGVRQGQLIGEGPEPEWVEVDTRRVRVERVRDFGGYWFGLQVWNKLGLASFLDEVMGPGREEVPWSAMAVVLVLMRLCHPSSELRIAEHLYERTAFEDLLGLLACFTALLRDAKAGTVTPEVLEVIETAVRETDLEYLMDEIPAAIRQTLEGVERVTKIVRAMKDFAHPDSNDKVMSDVNAALRSTALVASNEIRRVAELVLELSSLPPVPCHLGEISQVFLNLLVNAAHAIGDAGRERCGGRWAALHPVAVREGTGCRRGFRQLRTQSVARTRPRNLTHVPSHQITSQAHRSCVAAGRDQCGLCAGEIHPAWASFHAASVVGATSAGGGASGHLCTVGQ